MSNFIYLDYAQDELDRAYDQRVWALNMEAVLANCADEGAAIRKQSRLHADIGYGSGADEILDWFPAESGGRAIHIHLHGGAWRTQNKHDVSFVAPAFTTQGVHFIAPDFTNLPKIRLPEMIDQLRRAVAFVYRKASQFGGDPNRIFISGHSSGAHLCAVLLTSNWSSHGLPADIMKGGLCISGSYDLEPVMLSARRRYIDLAADEMVRYSPIRHVGDIACPVDVVCGGRESPEFIRQGLAFAEALSRSQQNSQFETLADLNHFETAVQLGRADSVIHSKAMTQIRSLPPILAS